MDLSNRDDTRTHQGHCSLNVLMIFISNNELNYLNRKEDMRKNTKEKEKLFYSNPIDHINAIETAYVSDSRYMDSDKDYIINDGRRIDLWFDVDQKILDFLEAPRFGVVETWEKCKIIRNIENYRLYKQKLLEILKTNREEQIFVRAYHLKNDNNENIMFFVVTDNEGFYIHM